MFRDCNWPTRNQTAPTSHNANMSYLHHRNPPSGVVPTAKTLTWYVGIGHQRSVISKIAKVPFREYIFLLFGRGALLPLRLIECTLDCLFFPTSQHLCIPVTTLPPHSSIQWIIITPQYSLPSPLAIGKTLVSGGRSF